MTQAPGTPAPEGEQPDGVDPVAGDGSSAAAAPA
ncbi:MAG: hypothetical protein JWP82_2557, partial [Humibacillus sp.]|nr:hypothetical protein [Humibacillus sp.]